MERRYVGIDLHRRRSVIVTMDETGEVLSSVRIPNDPVAMSIAVAEAGEGAEVAFEATYGWPLRQSCWPRQTTPRGRATIRSVLPMMRWQRHSRTS